VVRQEAADSERLEYHAAIEVTDIAGLPEGMVALEVPRASYARFEHRGPVQQLEHTVSYAYGTWLAQSGHRHTYGADLELYGAGYRPSDADSVIHYAIPIA
jgi:AraC family transcriptional regulator